MAVPRKRLKELESVISAEKCTLISSAISGGDHIRLRIRLPDGQEKNFFTALTCSDGRRGLLNFRSDIRRYIIGKPELEESEIQNKIMSILSEHPKVVWSIVTTTGKIKGRGGHWITLGYPGMADIVGQLRTGQVFAIEVKRPGQKPSKLQQEFIDVMNRFGGVAGWADSVDSALNIIS